jgi:hypothetical protein
MTVRAGGWSQGLLHLHPQKRVPVAFAAGIGIDVGTHDLRPLGSPPPVPPPPPAGQMTVRADSGVASILILKTVQNGIRGCFISHPQKNSSICADG